MNISYTRIGDYLLPNLILKDKEQFNIGKYGLLRIKYNLKIVKDNPMILKKFY